MATVSVSATGGTGPYIGTGNYSVPAGTYGYNVIDNNGCSDSTYITIAQPSAIQINTTQSNITCNGLTNGSASASVIGGVAPYAYSWSNGASSSSVNSLAAGTYTLTVTDDNGCSDSISIIISEPSALVANSVISNPILCNGDTATVTISATGGVPGYIGIGVFNIIAGSYNYTITDTNGCNAFTSINVLQPNALNSTISKQNISCFGANDGSAALIITGGTPGFTILWSNGATSTSINNLGPGNYSAIITDTNGCTSTPSTTIM